MFNWPVRFCTIGRKIPNPVERKETLVKEIHFDTLFRILRETDWYKTPVYDQYAQNKRWINNYDTIYSEIEIKYLQSSLNNMISDSNYDEINELEGPFIVQKHWAKTVATLHKLMNQMNMMYYFEKLKITFQQFTKDGKIPSLVHLEKIMSRCLKFY